MPITANHLSFLNTKPWLQNRQNGRNPVYDSFAVISRAVLSAQRRVTYYSKSNGSAVPSTVLRAPSPFSRTRFTIRRFVLQVSDWRFPYKRSHHPVCMHGGRVLTEYVLKNCDDGVQPGTELYVFPQATSCKCHACKSSEASCEGYRYRDFQFMHTNDV